MSSQKLPTHRVYEGPDSNLVHQRDLEFDYDDNLAIQVASKLMQSIRQTTGSASDLIGDMIALRDQGVLSDEIMRQLTIANRENGLKGPDCDSVTALMVLKIEEEIHRMLRQMYLGESIVFAHDHNSEQTASIGNAIGGLSGIRMTNTKVA